MSRKSISLIILLALFALCTYVAIDDGLRSSTELYIANMGPMGEVVFVGILVAGTVFAPMAALPLVPLASMVFGPFTTAILSIVGWTLGAVIAFYIARVFGRPILERAVRFDFVDQTISSLSPKAQFWFIVLLRHLIPVDILSYILGLSPKISFTTYFFATVLGVTYFSFAFAYAGEAFLTGKNIIFIEIVLFSLAIFAIGWYLLRHSKQ